MSDVLVVDRVIKRFGQAVVLDQLSINVRKGEIFGILGPNGAGKTTLVNIITGLLDADGGAVHLFGNSTPGDASVRSQIGLASQSLALYEELTARENLRFFGQMQNLAGAVLGDRVAQALAVAGSTSGPTSG